MVDYKLYNLKISVLTPLHIGSGVDLLHEYDYAIRDKKTWRINDAALLEAQNVEDPSVADMLSRTPPGKLLEKGDFQEDKPFFRYVIKGTPRSLAEGAQIGEQLKNVYDQPYIPGTSLKGAIRTAIGWVAWQQGNLKLDTENLNPRRQWAGSRYEQTIFGRDPNHDFLRALHIGDSQPASSEQLMILNVRVFDRGGVLSTPIELEVIRPDTIFEATLKFDRMLFSGWAKSHNLKLNGKELLENLSQVITEHSQHRIQEEIKWYKGVENSKRLVSFYQQISNIKLDSSSMLMQLGWGTGWDDKTFGSHLKADREFMEHIIDRYKLATGKRRKGDQFPKSRRVAVSLVKGEGDKMVETPAYPLGWLLLEMEPGKLSIER